MLTTIKDNQQVTVSLQGTDGSNNPTPLPATPVWAVSVGSGVTVVPAADGLSAVIKSSGPVDFGTIKNATVTVTCGSLPAINLDFAVIATITAWHATVSAPGPIV